MTPPKPDWLPRPGDAYRAFGTSGQTPRRLLHVVTGDYGRKTFEYADLERMNLVSGHDVMTLHFFGDVITDVVIKGRNLLSVYEPIGRHHLPWVWEHPSPADFADDKAAVISRITFNVIAR